MRLIYFSSVTWSSYAQRPHAMVKYFLEQGGEAVLWVEPYPSRLPSVRDLLRRTTLYDQETPRLPRVSLLNPRGLPIEPIPGGGWVNKLLMWRSALRKIKEFAVGNAVTVGVGRPSALALYALRELSPVASFYDAMDDFPEFYAGLSRAAMERREAAIAVRVDRVYVSSWALKTKFAFRKDAVMHLPNACDMSFLLRVGERLLDRIVIGYVGAIASWFDWHLVTKVARAMPSAEVRLVGPCFSRPPSDMPRNVRLLGPCRLEEVPAHLRTFSAGLIPFKVCRLTASVDPIKYYEYRAMGLPTLSTSFGEMKRREKADGVYFLDRGTNLVSVVNDALKWRPRQDDIARFRRENDWRYRFETARLFGEKAASLQVPAP